jgi:hypothetical protein
MSFTSIMLDILSNFVMAPNKIMKQYKAQITSVLKFQLL